MLCSFALVIKFYCCWQCCIGLFAQLVLLTVCSTGPVGLGCIIRSVFKKYITAIFYAFRFVSRCYHNIAG